MSYTIYDKAGNAISKTNYVNANECVASGDFTWVPPGAEVVKPEVIGLEKDIQSMRKVQLLEYAKTTFGEDLDETLQLEELQQQVLAMSRRDKTPAKKRKKLG